MKKFLIQAFIQRNKFVEIEVEEVNKEEALKVFYNTFPDYKCKSIQCKEINLLHKNQLRLKF